MTTVTQTIPVVDLTHLQGSGPEHEQAVKVLGDALREVGFFALTGHGVSDELVEQIYGLAQRFFELPEEQKKAYERPELKGQRGFTSFGRKHAKDSPAADLKEYISFGPVGDVPYPDNIWFDEVPELKDEVLGLFDRLQTCARETLLACGEYLDLPRETFAGMIEQGESLLRILHYPPVPEDRDVASVRSAAHEDINFITLLVGATAEGLQLLDRQGEWQPIRAIPGHIIIDSGDMLQHLTNGFFTSTTHRVTNPDDDRARRFSMPCFIHPRPEVDLTPLPACVERTGGEAKFESINAGDFLRQRLEELGL
ncbi:MAG TPA: isopenicillin N synthase family oxygenase [Planctomycetes bacterium]|nr:isopenicillin N synthase family oxygenase [Planctomycetota bacterium]